MNRNNLSLALLLSLIALSTACSDPEAGEGTVTINTYGESFIEDGIPASEVGDGWEVTFDKFDVTIANVYVGGETLAGPFTVDVSQSTDGAGHELGELTVPAGEHSGQAFSIEKVVLSGTAIKGEEQKTFSWTFDKMVHYENCEANTVVEDGGTTSFQVTIHADHYLYDSLVSEEPQVLFQALADADADTDGEITRAELEAADLGAYDPGNEDVSNLWEWLVAQNATLGHVDGEGHCDAHTHE
jgi:hypothetical protein